MWLNYAKTAARIGVLLGVKTLGDPRYIALDGVSDFPTARERKVGEKFVP